MIIFVIIGLILGATAVIFAFQNTMVITVTFLLWRFDASLAVVLILAIISGMIASLLVSIPELIEDYYKFRNVVKEKRRLEAEVESYKTTIADLNNKILDIASKSNETKTTLY